LTAGAPGVNARVAVPSLSHGVAAVAGEHDRAACFAETVTVRHVRSAASPASALSADIRLLCSAGTS
jgi:hypothetical protein